MSETLELTNLSAAYLSRYALALVRVLGAISLNPLLGSSRVPVPARIGTGIFITLVLFPPGGPDVEPVPVGPVEIAGELLVGLLAGFGVALIFAAVQFSAALLNVSMGIGFGSTVGSSVDLEGSGLERFFSAFALLVFVQINGHHLFLLGLRELFDTVGIASVTLNPATAERLAALSAGLFSSALKMALPALAALLLADLGLALLTRVAPQFNLFALGLPVQVLIGLMALAVALPAVLARMMALFRGLPGGMLGLAG